MADKERTRLRFSIKSLMAAITLLAVALGGWAAYASYKVKNLAALRKHDAIVTMRDQTPKTLKSIGINASPVFSMATVELYITPMGTNALVGTSTEPVPIADAQKYVLEKATEARANGARDIQLVLIDNLPMEWMDFARQHSLTVIMESKTRYMARLKANQESGANINPKNQLESPPR